MSFERRPVRPLRSVQFVPGDNAEAVEASLRQGSDGVILDLEEPRTPFTEAHRVAARKIVGDFLADLPAAGRPQYFSRVQDTYSGQMLKDLEAIVGPNLTGVVVPKILQPADVYAVDVILACLEADRGLEPGSISIYPILETAQSLRCSYEIAMASPRVAYIGGAVSRFGDIVHSIGYRWTPEGDESLYLRSKVLIDARAAGIRYPVSGMWAGNGEDHDGFRAFAEQLRDLGYYGMFISRADHIAICNEVFSPSAEELAQWRSMVKTVDEAGDSDEPIIFAEPGEEMHVLHRAHVASARQGLEWAADLGL